MERYFLYYLKLYNGQLLHAEGSSFEVAARTAGVEPCEVKRHMPVKKILTAEEIEARDERLYALRMRKKGEI